MDEQPAQLVKDLCEPLAATTPYAGRVDCEYGRARAAAVLLFCEPLSGCREATARERRAKVDRALETAALLEGCYAA